MKYRKSSCVLLEEFRSPNFRWTRGFYFSSECMYYFLQTFFSAHETCFRVIHAFDRQEHKSEEIVSMLYLIFFICNIVVSSRYRLTTCTPTADIEQVDSRGYCAADWLINVTSSYKLNIYNLVFKYNVLDGVNSQVMTGVQWVVVLLRRCMYESVQLISGQQPKPDMAADVLLYTLVSVANCTLATQTICSSW